MACPLAVPLTPTFTLTVLSVAGNRVDGITTVKALGVPWPSLAGSRGYAASAVSEPDDAGEVLVW
jgi:hypothetical protein